MCENYMFTSPLSAESEEYESATDEAMEAAHSYLNIPCLLTAEDFIR